MMKSFLLIPFLALSSCANSQENTLLFQDAYSAVFESFAELEINDPCLSRTLDKSLDEDVIRQDLNTYHKETLDRMGFDIEKSISSWEKFKGKDLTAYVPEEHLHFLIPEDSIIDRGTRVNLSAPVFNSDASMFYLYIVFEINEENNVNKSHQYHMYGKENGSWIAMMATSYYPDN